jgi:hypothetical protein
MRQGSACATAILTQLIGAMRRDSRKIVWMVIGTADVDIHDLGTGWLDVTMLEALMRWRMRAVRPFFRKGL